MQREHVLEVLSDPIAQELINSRIPARLAYVALDGTPRVVPVGFHWDGTHFIVGTATNSAKLPALRANPAVALTIDTETLPPHVLLVRGTATVEIVDGVADDFLAASRKRVDADQFEGFKEQVRGLYDQMARITIEPTWAKIHDFATRLPSAEEELIKQKMGS